ncbi:flagellin [Halorientalis brevis]|uniref:Flagellin n=1 Tax=Halorientalis brevis TaxID=1126241 RepID=A0ABD6CCA2_9EURY|nr:flagellin [Halorientalis brevis]
MGFSVSGSAAIVFAGMFIAFSIFYGAASNSFERVAEAQHDNSDRVVDQRNVDIEIVYYERSDTTPNRLTILVNNTGSKVVNVEETDLIVDNEYLVPDDTTVIQTDGSQPDTNLWAPGEQLNITVRGDSLYESDRVKIVTEHGIADTVIVSGETQVVL